MQERDTVAFYSFRERPLPPGRCGGEQGHGRGVGCPRPWLN